MSHQCVHCGEIYPVGSRVLLDGCSKCKSHFFFYIREDHVDKMKQKEIEIPKEERKQVEKDIREIVGIKEEDAPVILDVESIRVIGYGKFELDLVKLLNKKHPLVYKLEEGKYIIDLASSLSNKDFSKEDGSID